MSNFQEQIAGLTPAQLALLQEKLKGLKSGAAQDAGIQRRTQRESAPLSSAQQRAWFLDQLESGSPAYNRPAVFRLRGTLNLKVLEDSLTEIVRRHEILRTRFSASDGQPVQVILPCEHFAIFVEDLSGVPASSREERMLELVREDGQKSFSLERGALLSAKILRLAEDDHVLLVNMHHIVTDGWSIGVFIRELAACYEAYSTGTQPQLAELPIQYGDFAVWQEEWLRGEDFNKQLAYWKRQLANAPEFFELPADYPRPATQTYNGAVFRLEAGAELTTQLKQAARGEGVTLFMTLLAAFNTLLHRTSGREDILVGTPIANRSRRELENLIGFFANTLVMRTDLSGDPTFRELLKRVKEVALGAHKHQDLPFEKLVEEMHVERDLSHHPLFQVMFVLQNSPLQPLKLSSLQVEPLEVSNQTAKFDLTLIITEQQGQLVFRFEYNTDLFAPETIERMAGHFQTLLAAIPSNLERRISEIPLMSAGELERVLVEWNQTRIDYPRDRAIHELFEEQAERTPDRVAVVFQDEELSYGELNRRANRLAHYLAARGVEPGALVGLCLERAPEMLVAILGILKAGGAYVPLDASYPPERLAFMLEDIRAQVLLTGRQFEQRFSPHAAQVIYLDSDWDAIAAQPAHNPARASDPLSTAYVMYTSGSTGQPKGVCIPHRAVVRLVRETNYVELNPSEVFLQFAPISFDASTLEIWGSLLNGARLVLMPQAVSSLEELGQAIRAHGVTTLWLTAGLFHQMVEHQLEDLKRVRQLLAGGDVLSVPHVQKFLREADGSTLINGYGPTENTTFTCCHPMTDGARINSSVPIGRPISNTQIYLLDGRLEPVPVGVVGSLYIGGDGLAHGYLNQPALTAERFIPHPFAQEPGARLYQSGDLARYRADGTVEFIGRKDNQLKIRGFRVELGEIEAVLSLHPGVTEAVAVARDEPDGGKRIVAYVVGAQSYGTSAAELRSYLKQKLPAYMLPALFVMLDELPLTPNGKVDRGALPAPESSLATDAGENYVEARDGIEELVAGIWEEVLGAERVGVFDNFFDLGGHSLMAMRVVTRIRKTFNVELGVRSLFEHPTAASLSRHIAAAIGGGGAEGVGKIERVSREAGVPLSFAQERLYFMERLAPGSPIYNVPVSYRVEGELNLKALERSIVAVVARHETLRTEFKAVEGDVLQFVADSVECRMELIDLSALADDEREREAQRLAIEEARRDFDLTAAPLLRAKVLRLSDEQHLLLITMHHLVTDGWSMNVFMRELAACYKAFSRDAEPQLPELHIQYADYAAWQREHMHGETWSAQLAYWKQQLASAPGVLELPTDAERPALQTFKGDTQRFEIGAELTARLKQLSREQGATLFMTLLAAFNVLLSRYSGQQDILVGTPVANRNRVEVENLIGFFVNTLALRARLDADMSFRQLLVQMRETCLAAYAHQDMPFEKLVEELQPERSLSRHPLFQVVFSLESEPNQVIELNGAKLTPRKIETQTSKFDLFLQLNEEGDHLQGRLVYSSDLFAGSTISYMLRHFDKLLQSVAADPDTRLDELDMLLEEERALLGVAHEIDEFETNLSESND
ncbi:MAG TPA: amino acid adenylation domain-containing protein [Pyrinomonadaceae bacterium]|nr:amino acid adenylation domain-containing protein [Pyrinomonadaceae bacterium]